MIDMNEGLKPCPHRRVDDSGRILCGWIKNGDNQVSVNLCRACAVPQINCQHLRASLQKTTPTPITVRYATGRVEVWNDEAPSIDFKQAACSAKTMPIQSARDCSGCPLRMPNVIPQTAIQVARQNRPAASLDAAVASRPNPPAAIPTVAAPPSAVVAKKQPAAEARMAREQPAVIAEERSARHQMDPAARTAIVQPQASAQPMPAPQPRMTPAAQPAVDSGAAQELIERARKMAAQQAPARRVAEQAVAAPQPLPAAKRATAQKAEPTPQPMDTGAAQELIARAQKMAAQKEQARRAIQDRQETEQTATAQATNAGGPKKSKIILLQQWLADQVVKRGAAEPTVPQPEEEGVQDIVYAPIAPTYAEEPGLERCVGWTD
ncbi:MAG: hypothetical protein WCF84_22785 [Anaerolineae bacterium]